MTKRIDLRKLKESILEEAKEIENLHPSKDARAFAHSVKRYFLLERKQLFSISLVEKGQEQ